MPQVRPTSNGIFCVWVARKVGRVLLVAAALVACLPAARLIQKTFARAPVVNRASPAWKAREALIARAHVFVDARPAIRRLDLSDPPRETEHLDRNTRVECRYVPKPTSGTTLKFDCRLPDGVVIKIKYGETPERLAEVAATRLLAALGFGADEVTLLPKLRCHGCPRRPYETRKFAEWFYAEGLLDRLISDDTSQDFSWVSAEHKMPGRAIEVGEFEGWDWYELDRVDSALGGATRPELDALRLIAIFLGHWDNKARNQRLQCEPGPGDDDPSARCERPLLMIQDVGATFGPGKVEQSNWAATPIWADAAGCVVRLPHIDGTFDSIKISEGGRLLIASRLRQLSEAQIQTIFNTAGFPDPSTGDANGNVTAWVKAFKDKVRQIGERQPCPALDR